MSIRTAMLACNLIFILVPALAGTCMGESKPTLKPYEAPNKSYALYKPVDWKVQEELGPKSQHVRVLAVDASAAVDFFWDHNQEGRTDALLALRAFSRCLERLGVEGTWSAVCRSPDSSHATASLRYPSPQGPVLGTFYFEASPETLVVQGYHALESVMVRQRPVLLNIMASFAIAKSTGKRLEKDPVFQPQYVTSPLKDRYAQDGSLTMKAPDDWNFLAVRG